MFNGSIVSYKDRGPFGDARWRGNASGWLYKDLLEQLRPRLFVDVMTGSGTAVDVAKELGVRAIGLDLHSGFNALRDSILARVGEEADLVVSHPPYGGMIKYSGSVWGSEAHRDDLSHCVDDADFHEKMQLVLLNQREATVPGGYFGALIGDFRHDGRYVSYQAEVIARMPSDELAGIIIKAQHNCMSNSKQYGSMQLPRILHEYLVLWRKRAMPVLVLLSSIAREQSARLSGTWKSIVRAVLVSLGGRASLQDIYARLAQSAPDRLATNPSWQAKVRQTLQLHPELFAPGGARGEWACV